MNNVEYQNLFIVPVCKVDLLSIDNLKLKEYAFKLRKNESGRTLSNVGGWQSKNVNLKAKETKELSKKTGSAQLTEENLTVSDRKGAESGVSDVAIKANIG
jgi:hypothetical protein